MFAKDVAFCWHDYREASVLNLDIIHDCMFIYLYMLGLSLTSVCMHLSLFHCVQLFVTLWNVTHQTPLSLEFSRQEYWSELPCPPPGDLPDPDWTWVSCITGATRSAGELVMKPNSAPEENQHNSWNEPQKHLAGAGSQAQGRPLCDSIQRKPWDELN